ncbi:MAG: hypothetical protein Q4F33_01200 [Mycoplasmatota bacterium]|nr:hypothetical protein [Mycoplasmatota bacterium]
MKKKYENNQNLIIISWLFLIIALWSSLTVLNKEIYIYKKISGVLYTDSAMEVVISREDTKLLQKNKYVFINNKKMKIKIVQVNENILRRNKTSYNQVFINIGEKVGSVGEVVSVTAVTKRIKVANIFKIIWEGDNDS